MAETNNRLQLKVGKQVYVLTFAVDEWPGEMLEVVEERLEEPVLGWARRLSIAFERGVRVSELRVRDILALVYMARVQVEPDISWQDVARTTAPYAVRISDVEEPAATPPPLPQLREQIEAPREELPPEARSPMLAALEQAKATRPADEPEPKDEALTPS